MAMHKEINEPLSHIGGKIVRLERVKTNGSSLAHATRPEHYCDRNRCIRPIAGPRERSSTHIHQVRLFEPLPIAFELLPTVEKRVEAGVKLMEELSHALEEPVSKEKDRDSRWELANVDSARS